jgi:hypothetical protein
VSLELELMELTLYVNEHVPAAVRPELMRRMRRIMRQQYARLMAAEADLEVLRLINDMGHMPYHEEPEGEDHGEIDNNARLH